MTNYTTHPIPSNLTSVDAIFNYAGNVTNHTFEFVVFFLIVIMVYMALSGLGRVRALAGTSFIGIIVSTFLFFWGKAGPLMIILSVIGAMLSAYLLYKERNQ